LPLRDDLLFSPSPLRVGRLQVFFRPLSLTDESLDLGMRRSQAKIAVTERLEPPTGNPTPSRRPTTATAIIHRRVVIRGSRIGGAPSARMSGSAMGFSRTFDDPRPPTRTGVPILTEFSVVSGRSGIIVIRSAGEPAMDHRLRPTLCGSTSYTTLAHEV
jgi:hypothetical protein